MTGFLDRLDRRFPRLAFARRVPPRRIATRILRRIDQRLDRAARLAVPEGALRPVTEWPAVLFPAAKASVIRDAEGWRFGFLGVEKRFAEAIDWRAEGPGIGQLWRMNLHYFEYLASLSTEDGIEAIRQWIVANPPRGAAAHEAGWNAYAVSLRVICWLQFLRERDPVLEARDRADIERSLRHQAAFLARFPETDLGGNHVVKNIKALGWAGACFDGAAGRTFAVAAERLARSELPLQVLSDGMHFERSPSYHCQVAADLIETAAASASLRAGLIETAATMTAAATALTHPDGRIAQFNDAGLDMAVDSAALAAAMRSLGAGPSETPRCSVLPTSGLASLRTGQLSTFVKYGIPGPRTLPAHAHGDVGTFELSVGRHRAIVDQGVFEYITGDRRRASRAAANHNVTAPEGADMADFFGAFRCGWMPDPIVRTARCDGGALTIDVEHDGFSLGGHTVSVRRRLHATACAVSIEDNVSGARHRVGWASRFLLHPHWQALQERGGWRLLGPDGAALRLECAGDVTIEPAEWWPDMGVACVTTRLVLRWDEAMPSMAVRLCME